MIVIKRGIRELVIDPYVSEEVFLLEFDEYCRRCGEPKHDDKAVKELFKAAKNIENNFQKL